MANYATLDAAIQAAIYENATNDITGTALQTVLLQMVTDLGKAGMLCNGVADGATVPPVSPDSNIFYIAPPGTYSNFGGLTVGAGEWAIFIYNGTWQKQGVPVVTLINNLTAGGADKALTAEMGKVLGAQVAGILAGITYTTTYIFDPANSPRAELTQDIVLSANGDSIEFDILAANFPYSNSDGYAFAGGINMSKIAIGLFSNHISVRYDDNSWLNYSGSPVGHFLLKWENNEVNLYLDGVVVATTSATKTLTIRRFGYNSTYNYWNGTVKDIKVNGANYFLAQQSSTITGITINDNSTFLNATEQGELADAIAPKMMVEKTATLLTVYLRIGKSSNYIAYPLNYRYKAYTPGDYPCFYDNWGLGKCYVATYEEGAMTQGMFLFQAGEAELAIDAQRGDDPSQYKLIGGGAHGFENIITGGDGREFLLLVDEQKIGEGDTLTLRTCSRVEVQYHSELVQAYTNSNPWAEVTKRWLWENGEMQLSIALTVLRVVSVNNCYMGMLCVLRRSGDSSSPYLTNRTIKMDVPYHTYNTEDGWWDDSANTPIQIKDHDCKKIVEYGELGYGFSMERITDTIKTNGGMFVSNNALGNNYNKIYLALTGIYTPTLNETLSANLKWLIL